MNSLCICLNHIYLVFRSIFLEHHHQTTCYLLDLDKNMFLFVHSLNFPHVWSCEALQYPIFYRKMIEYNAIKFSSKSLWKMFIANLDSTLSNYFTSLTNKTINETKVEIFPIETVISTERMMAKYYLSFYTCVTKHRTQIYSESTKPSWICMIDSTMPILNRHVLMLEKLICLRFQRLVHGIASRTHAMIFLFVFFCATASCLFLLKWFWAFLLEFILVQNDTAFSFIEM